MDAIEDTGKIGDKLVADRGSTLCPKETCDYTFSTITLTIGVRLQ